MTESFLCAFAAGAAVIEQTWNSRTYPHHSQPANEAMHYGHSLGNLLEEAPEALYNVIQLIDACQSNT